MTWSDRANYVKLLAEVISSSLKYVIKCSVKRLFCQTNGNALNLILYLNKNCQRTAKLDYYKSLIIRLKRRDQNIDEKQCEKKIS